MRNTNTATFTKPDGTTVELSTGCVFDGAYGWHNGPRVYWLARDLGYGDDASRFWGQMDALVTRYDEGETDVSESEHVLEQIDRAESFLESGIEDGFTFAWDDGFYLWAIEDDYR